MKVLFIHRSVGQNMLNDSGLRRRLKKARLYDINANTLAYTDPADKNTRSPIAIENGSIEPENLARFFQKADNQKFLSSFDCIIFKSCYTANALKNDAKVQSQLQSYEKIIDYIKKHPEQCFIFCTSPPRRPLFTDKRAAARAKEIQHWIIKRSNGLKNVEVLDIFGLLANSDGMLDKQYRRFLFFDQHPNKSGSINFANELEELLGAIIQSR